MKVEVIYIFLFTLFRINTSKLSFSCLLFPEKGKTASWLHSLLCSDCEHSLSVPQNQTRKHKKSSASRLETASREDCGREERFFPPFSTPAIFRASRPSPTSLAAFVFPRQILRNRKGLLAVLFCNVNVDVRARAAKVL